MKKKELNKRKYLRFDTSIFDGDPFEGNYPHLRSSYFVPNVPDSIMTACALEYIFEKQGYCPKDINWSFDEKRQTFRISFRKVELFETGKVASLIKSICQRSKKCQLIRIDGVKTLEYTIKIRELNLIVFVPKHFVRGGNLIQEVLKSLKFLDDCYIKGHPKDDVTVHFKIQGQVLKMKFADLSGKVIKSYYGNLSEKFLILTSQDKAMAEYLLSLNSNPDEDRLIIHVRYIIMFEGQLNFGCYESDSLQEESKKKFEQMAWVKTRERIKKLDLIIPDL